MYKQQQMKSEFVRKTTILHDRVFRCAIKTPPCGPCFLSDRDWGTNTRANFLNNDLLCYAARAL